MGFQTAILILLLLLLMAGGQCEGGERGGGSRGAARLLQELVGDPGQYTPHARPVHQPSNTTTVIDVTMQLHQFIGLNAKDQYIKAIVWFSFSWHDEFLTWDPKDYDGIGVLHLPVSKIWRPDLTMLNSVDENRPSFSVLADSDVILNASGSVKWLTSMLAKASCEVDVTLYPFDTQYCEIKLGSWTYTSQEVNITCHNPQGEIGQLASNGEWELVDLPCSTNQVKYECCESTFTDITYTVVVHRKAMFYLYNLVYPCILLCVLGMLAFCLPSESGERVSLSVTVLLSLVVFLLVVMDNLPPTSDVISLLDMFFGAAVGILSLITITSILLVRCYYQGQRGRRLPRWIRKHLLTRLAKCSGEDLSEDEDTTIKPPFDFSSLDLNGAVSDKYEFRPSKQQNQQLCADTAANQPLLLETVLQRLEVITRSMEHAQKVKVKAEKIQNEWNILGHNLDTLFFYLFVLCTVVVTLAVFCKVQ